MNIPGYAQRYLSQLANEKSRTARAAIEIEFGAGDFPVGPINDTIDASYGLLVHDEKTTLSVSQSPEAALGEYVLSQQSAAGTNSTMVLLRTADDNGFGTTTFAVKVIGTGTLTINLWNAATGKHSKTYSAEVTE